MLRHTRHNATCQWRSLARRGLSSVPSLRLREAVVNSSSNEGANVFVSEFRKAGLLGTELDSSDPIANHISVKDNIASKDGLTTCASGILQNHHSPFEAHVLQRLRQNGVSIEGKTNLDEFGMGSNSTNSFFGTVRNAKPFDQYSVGGSSGGSAVAVATGRCEVALGTDTGGSVRLPAAYTGIAGFKPSYGKISRWGVIPYANSLDTVGILGSSVDSISKIFDMAKGYDSRDPTSLKETSRFQVGKSRTGSSARIGSSFAKIKIGVPLEYNIAELQPEIRQAWTEALELLQAEGCTIVPVSLPNTKHALSAYYVLAPAEAASNLSKYDGVRYGSRSEVSDGTGGSLYSRTRGEGFGDEVKRRILLGSYTLSSEAMDNYFIQAQKIRRLVQKDFDQVFSLPNPLHEQEQFDLSQMDEKIELENKFGPPQVDLLLCPTAPSLPPHLDDISKQTPIDSYMNDVFTVPASLAGLPAISIPFQIKSPQAEGQKFAGIQLIGQYSDDDRVLEVAFKIESLQARAVRSSHAKRSGPLPVDHSHEFASPFQNSSISFTKINKVSNKATLNQISLGKRAYSTTSDGKPSYDFTSAGWKGLLIKGARGEDKDSLIKVYVAKKIDENKPFGKGTRGENSKSGIKPYSKAKTHDQKQPAQEARGENETPRIISYESAKALDHQRFVVLRREEVAKKRPGIRYTAHAAEIQKAMNSAPAVRKIEVSTAIPESQQFQHNVNRPLVQNSPKPKLSKQKKSSARPLVVKSEFAAAEALHYPCSSCGEMLLTKKKIVKHLWGTYKKNLLHRYISPWRTPASTTTTENSRANDTPTTTVATNSEIELKEIDCLKCGCTFHSRNDVVLHLYLYHLSDLQRDAEIEKETENENANQASSLESTYPKYTPNLSFMDSRPSLGQQCRACGMIFASQPTYSRPEIRQVLSETTAPSPTPRIRKLERETSEREYRIALQAEKSALRKKLFERTKSFIGVEQVRQELVDKLNERMKEVLRKKREVEKALKKVRLAAASEILESTKLDMMDLEEEGVVVPEQKFMDFELVGIVISCLKEYARLAYQDGGIGKMKEGKRVEDEGLDFIGGVMEGWEGLAKGLERGKLSDEEREEMGVLMGEMVRCCMADEVIEVRCLGLEMGVRVGGDDEEEEGEEVKGLRDEVRRRREWGFEDRLETDEEVVGFLESVIEGGEGRLDGRDEREMGGKGESDEEVVAFLADVLGEGTGLSKEERGKKSDEIMRNRSDGDVIEVEEDEQLEHEETVGGTSKAREK